MYRFTRTPEFKKRFHRKSPPEQAAVLKSLSLLAESLDHPSLNTHPLTHVRTADGKRVYDASVTRKLRITFEMRPNSVIHLRMNCQHDKVLRNP